MRCNSVRVKLVTAALSHAKTHKTWRSRPPTNALINYHSCKKRCHKGSLAALPPKLRVQSASLKVAPWFRSHKCTASVTFGIQQQKHAKRKANKAKLYQYILVYTVVTSCLMLVRQTQHRHFSVPIQFYFSTSSTAQGDSGSFKDRKPIGEVSCRDACMAERTH